MSKSFWGTVGVLIIVLGVVLVLRQWQSFSPVKLALNLEPLRLWVKSFGWWSPAVYILIFILRPIALFPSTPVTFLGGLLFGFTNGVIIAMIGSALSSVLEFCFIRHWAGAKIKNFVREKADVIANATEKKGFLTVFFIRLIPNVTFDLQNCALALTPVSLGDYFWGTMAGCLPPVMFYVFLGNQMVSFIKAIH